MVGRKGGLMTFPFHFVPFVPFEFIVGFHYIHNKTFMHVGH